MATQVCARSAKFSELPSNTKRADFYYKLYVQNAYFRPGWALTHFHSSIISINRTGCPPQISQSSARILGQAAAQILTASWDIESRSGRHFPKVPITSKNFSGANTRIYGFLERKLTVKNAELQKCMINCRNAS